MTGGSMSAVHRLTVERSCCRLFVVLRQYEHAAAKYRSRVEREVSVLPCAISAGLPAPQLIAFSSRGEDVDGRPSVLMTRLHGHLDLVPEDPDTWLRQTAAMAARIHNTPIKAKTFLKWINPRRLTVPASALRPELWQTAFKVLQEQQSRRPSCFIHRDFQHFNLLWARGRLTGVVDWAVASSGPPEIDVGHCRLNLAVLHGSDWAEHFRLAYEAETGRITDPWWDLYALASYSDAWRRTIKIHVARRAPVDTVGMTTRVEELLDSTLRRL